MIKKLLEVCDFQGGTQPPKDEWLSMPQEGYIRMLQIRDYTQGDEKFIEYVLDNGKLHKCTEEDIMLSRYGYIGQAFMGLSGAYNVALVKVIKKEDVLTKYLLYYFRSRYFQHHLTENVGARATIPGFNKSELKNAVIDIPSKERQAYIANVLSTINEIIVQRQQELKTYDDLIKARFVEMFGDETNPYNWSLINIEEVADVSVGVVIKPAQYYTDAEHGVKTFRSLNIGPMRIKDSDWVFFSRKGNEKNAKSQLKENDLLIVRSGAPGTACVVPKEYAGCNAIDIIIARPNTKLVNPYYLCFFTNMPHGKKQIEIGTGGAAQQHFNVSKYNKLKLMMPPIELQNEFVAFIKQIDKSKFVQAITFLI